MIENRSHYCQLRLTLEAKSAHGVHRGRGDATHDVLLVRDANGLPALPGSSLAGVLRHAYADRYGAKEADALFGFIGKGQHPSWLTVSWGLVHGSDNQVREGLDIRVEADGLLADLIDSKPLVRQRVRLNDRGTADDMGKFDTTLIPAGARYTTFLGYWCDGSDASRKHWHQLLEVLSAPQLRIGHGTRSGAGSFSVQSLHGAIWDLRTPEGRAAYCARPRSRNSFQGLRELELKSSSPELSVTLDLVSEGPWRIGGGERPIAGSTGADVEKIPDLLPMHEPRITWENGQGALGKQVFLLPGSAIKGALRHRVAYHYRCLKGEFTDCLGEHEVDQCPAVRELFGYAEDSGSAAGVVTVPDIHIQPGSNTGQMMHNRIDRFTGGVMRGALFGEQVLWNTPLRLSIGLGPDSRLQGIGKMTRMALQRTLEDLAQGWLPLGAGGSRGLGAFSAISQDGNGPQWSDNGSWVDAAPTNRESE